MMALPGRILRIQRILRITAIYRSLLGTEQRFKVELAAMPTSDIAVVTVDAITNAGLLSGDSTVCYSSNTNINIIWNGRNTWLHGRKQWFGMDDGCHFWNILHLCWLIGFNTISIYCCQRNLW